MLKDLVTLEENNTSCVILEVKPNSFKELIKLGCFSGDEKMIRVTKGRNHTYTIWHGEENKSYSWNWGESGYTLVSDSMHEMRRLIMSTIEGEFGISLK